MGEVVMSELFKYGLLAVAIVCLELFYFRVAIRYHIIDKPNERSSHHLPTVRGAGIIFLFAVLIWFALEQTNYWFVVSIVLLGIISFLDDLKTISSALRISVHLVSMALLFYETSFSTAFPLGLVIVSFIVAVGILSAFNFMDGINGITGIYALVTLSTLWFINRYHINFTTSDLLVMVTIGLVIFLFFNFRKKAACFAGDVGSITLAGILVFWLLQLIVATHDFRWIILLAVYGIDSVSTICFRLYRRENIFKAHRSHLYQYLSNELKWPHRMVSLLYGFLQLLINLAYLTWFQFQPWYFMVLLTVACALLYLLGRKLVLQKIAGLAQ
jgi:UDP-N-acetylmuramyl pentapeptide phosphotransferase/UDP-N-acetylglucosamine-1-phosphate transferase